MVVVAQRLTGHQSACGKWRVIAFESLVDLEGGVSSFLLLLAVFDPQVSLLCSSCPCAVAGVGCE